MKRLAYAGLALGVLIGFTVSYWPDSGAARNSGGTYSLPAGNPVVTGTTITSTWANTTLSDLGSEITNSLDRTGRGCMTGQLQSAAGTSSAPGVTFCAEPASGFWRAGAGDIRFGIDSAENLQFLKSYNQMRVTLVTDGGINAQQGYTNLNGIDARGNGTGSGISSTGGATGVGVTGTGGGTSGYGGSFTGGGTTAGLYADNGTDSTAASPREAIKSDGTIALQGANPNPDAGFTDTLAPTSLVKAWARMTTGIADPQIAGGFNVTTATCAANNVTLNLSNGVTGASSAIFVNSGDHYICIGALTGNTTAVVSCEDNAGGTVNLCTVGSLAMSVMVLGPQ